MHWENRLFLTFESRTIHSFFLDSVKQCYLQTKKHAVTSSERAHSITWYKQKRCRNRWVSKQVSRRYLIKKVLPNRYIRYISYIYALLANTHVLNLSVTWLFNHKDSDISGQPQSAQSTLPSLTSTNQSKFSFFPRTIIHCLEQSTSLHVCLRLPPWHNSRGSFPPIPSSGDFL